MNASDLLALKLKPDALRAAVAFERLTLDDLVRSAPRSVLVVWAADCAEHVLPLFETRFPDDARPRRAIEVARSGAAHAAAVADAAHAAAHAAARAADAAYAARAAHAAADAAEAAALAADAAAAAARAAYAAYAARATDAAEREWQLDHLVMLLGATA
jgi:hypothetical protein